jgi:hypothetical protein
MTLRDETILLTRAQVSRRIKFSTDTIRKWTLHRVAGWPQPIPCGPQREHRWREVDIASWVRRQMRDPAPKRKLQGALAPTRSKRRA